MKFTIRYNKPGIMGWLSFLFYAFMLFHLFVTGDAWYIIGAVLWAFLFQMNTGMHLAPPAKEPEKP